MREESLVTDHKYRRDFRALPGILEEKISFL